MVFTSSVPVDQLDRACFPGFAGDNGGGYLSRGRGVVVVADI